MKPRKSLKKYVDDFSVDPVVKNPSANAGDMGPIPVQEDPPCWGLTKIMHQDSIEPMP